MDCLSESDSSDTISDGGAGTLTSLGSASEQALSVERLLLQRPANPPNHPRRGPAKSGPSWDRVHRTAPHFAGRRATWLAPTVDLNC
jgi:hypothetical protein